MPTEMSRHWACSLVWLLAACRLSIAALGAEQVVESPRPIPVAADVDVVVVGGSSGAVEAACAAAAGGERVFLLAPRPYLGTALCATLRLWLEDGEEPRLALARDCFGKDGSVGVIYAF